MLRAFKDENKRKKIKKEVGCKNNAESYRKTEDKRLFFGVACRGWILNGLEWGVGLMKIQQ
jgi:hypothetical protein